MFPRPTALPAAASTKPIELVKEFLGLDELFSEFIELKPRVLFSLISTI